MQLGAARKLLGRAIGQCPKAKLFRAYIELEVQLGAIERVRTLYQKFLEWAPSNCAAWCKFADLERSLGELDRARSIFELAIAQPVLDMPEVLWKVLSPSPVTLLCFGQWWATSWKALVCANKRPDKCLGMIWCTHFKWWCVWSNVHIKAAGLWCIGMHGERLILA